MGTKKLFLQDSIAHLSIHLKEQEFFNKLVLDAESSTGNLAHLTSEEPPLE